MDITTDVYVIGVDYGTDSVRSLIVNAKNGNELASSVYQYPRWKEGLYCEPRNSQFRQHPLDYIEGLEFTVNECLKQVNDNIKRTIKAISVTTTGSTPVAVDDQGTPLGLLPEFKDNPNAQFILWKDHTAIKEAEEINRHAATFNAKYLRDSGGVYSSEWFWSKLLHVMRADEQVRSAASSWIEHSDWLPFMLTGNNRISQIKRNICAAGHKGMWSEAHGGLPPEAFLQSLDPIIKNLDFSSYAKTYKADECAGNLSKEWAGRLNLSEDVLVGIGALDAHMGAVGGQIEPYHLMKVMGTSTCDMVTAPKEDMEYKSIAGISGQVNDSIIPGMVGMEAGQSAFGDAFAWFSKLVLWPLSNYSNKVTDKALQLQIQHIGDNILNDLSDKASKIEIDINTELAIDWMNGRRTPYADQSLKGAFTHLDLGTDAPAMFRALVEATCFGARSIMECFENQEVKIEGVIGIGGVAQKSPYIMQTMADVLNKPIKIHHSEHTSALGACMFASTIAGVFDSVEEAMDKMGKGFIKEYEPGPGREIYDLRYGKYLDLGRYIDNRMS